MKSQELFKIKSNTLRVKSGEVLISEPFTNDFYFCRSVVLLVEHDEKEGSFGVIVNKRMNVTVNELIVGFPRFNAGVYLGGPVGTDQIFYIHSLGKMIPDSHKICEGMYWGGNLNAIKSLIKAGLLHESDISFYVGYSGWDGGQLMEELKRNSWLVAPLRPKILLQTSPTEMWNAYIDALGDRYMMWKKFPIFPDNN